MIWDMKLASWEEGFLLAKEYYTINGNLFVPTDYKTPNGFSLGIWIQSQRKLKKGYNSVVTILEQLAAEGYISDIAQGNKEQRKILISKEDFYAEWEKRFGKHDPDETDDTDGE